MVRRGRGAPKNLSWAEAPKAPELVTSASEGFRTGQRVCLGYVEGRRAGTVDGFTIDGYGVDLPATRHEHGIYDPDHERP